MNCHTCNKEIIPQGFAAGYTTKPDGTQICYSCAGQEEIDWIKTHDKWTGYLTKIDGQWYVSNWPGSMKIKVLRTWTGRHNWYCVKEVRYVNFVGPDGAIWTGRQIGDNDLLRCKRTKLTR